MLKNAAPIKQEGGASVFITERKGRGEGGLRENRQSSRQEKYVFTRLI